MFAAFSSVPNRMRTLILLAACAGLAAAAAALGVDDNPPGLLLAFLSAGAFILAFAHPWRASKKFRSLALASLLGLVVFTALQIGLDLFFNPGSAAPVPAWLDGLINLITTAAILLLLAGLLVGGIGELIMRWRERHP